ncbi:MAG: ribosomal-processing cysteine protease Prp [Bacilli bacterium]|nr:ribosomal-processing cysteine protease Prp [Bacilli bacterium]MBR4811868.1 ribosomal-processing cysteine protease Prp [Bacilli bacterium]MBR5750135.1 ribosomal-processing cysteine protease Prp [Bacilli bacterium]MBR5990782.1 ribosomal-processing cysteine protease Prp [Bacilli bacterium]MBR6225792.1 ribosomal-processing cysteine protease Prp [Bacilli bacterium]
MIKATFVYRDKDLKSLTVKGHANSAPYGEDLVCAAISAIVVGGLNAYTDDPSIYEAKVEEGNVELLVKGKQSIHDQIVNETIESQIKDVAASYPKHVTLERKKEE